MIANSKDGIGVLFKIIRQMQVRIDELKERHHMIKFDTNQIMEIQDQLTIKSKKKNNNHHYFCDSVLC